MLLSLLPQALLEVFGILWLVEPIVCLHLPVELSLGACLSKFSHSQVLRVTTLTSLVGGAQVDP